jgi:hypothetical protein
MGHRKHNHMSAADKSLHARLLRPNFSSQFTELLQTLIISSAITNHPYRSSRSDGARDVTLHYFQPPL